MNEHTGDVVERGRNEEQDQRDGVVGGKGIGRVFRSAEDAYVEGSAVHQVMSEEGAAASVARARARPGDPRHADFTARPGRTSHPGLLR